MLCWVALGLGWMVGTFNYIGSHVVCVVVEERLEYFHTVSAGKIRFDESGRDLDEAIDIRWGNDVPAHSLAHARCSI